MLIIFVRHAETLFCQKSPCNKKSTLLTRVRYDYIINILILVSINMVNKL